MKKVLLLLVACMLFVTIPVDAKPKSLWLLGDATMADYSGDSISACGWGKAFEQYAPSKRYKLENVAAVGMSAKVFKNSELLSRMEKLRNRSIIFVQFGTNDLKEYNGSQYTQLDAFATSMNELVTLARQNRLNIVLCTPLAQPYYKDGELIDRLGGYAEVLRRVATYNYLPLLDLEATSKEWLQGMTEEEAAAYYVTLDPAKLPNGEYQLNEAGAAEIARMAKEAIEKGNSKKLKKVLKTK